MPRAKKKLTIGLVLDDTLDSTDGVQQHVLRLGEWLNKRGHEVHYITSSTERTDIANVHSLTRAVRMSFNGNKVGTPLPITRKRARLLHTKIDFDVLHVQTPHSPFYSQKIITSAPHKTVVIGTFHILPYGYFEQISTKILGLSLRSSLKRISAMIAVSSPAAKLCKSAFGLEPAIIPNMIDTDSLQKRSKQQLLPQSKINIVFLGRLVERKGCLYLLKAVRRINETQTLSNVHVTICSDGPERRKLEAFVQQNDLTGVVTFKGFIDEEDKAPILRQADIAVFPSTSGESFGIVLLEAMAAGSSVVLAGNNPGYVSVMEHKDQLFDPTDTKLFAHKLSTYINDPKLRKSTKKQQQLYVKQFDINVVGAKIEQMYLAAIANKRQKKDNEQ